MSASSPKVHFLSRVFSGMLALAGCKPGAPASAEVKTSCVVKDDLTVRRPVTECTVTASFIDGPFYRHQLTSSMLRDSTRAVTLEAAFQLQKGRLRVSSTDGQGQTHSFVVQPSEPQRWTGEVSVRNVSDGLSLLYEPLDGRVEGVTATVRFWFGE
jgi:hypothetical protein